jgi:hypothetical protein
MWTGEALSSAKSSKRNIFLVYFLLSTLAIFVGPGYIKHDVFSGQKAINKKDLNIFFYSTGALDKMTPFDTVTYFF